jgi:hypothetical protein
VRRVITLRMVARYHCAAPCAVGTPCLFRCPRWPDTSVHGVAAARFVRNGDRHRRGASKTNPLRLFHSQRVSRPLSDESPLELCEDGKYVDHRLARWGRRVNSYIERD